MKTTKTTKRKSKDKVQNTLDLKSAIETLSINNEIDPKEISSSLAEIIKDELSEHLAVLDDDVEVTFNDEFCMNLFLHKTVREVKEHPILDISQEEANALGLATDLDEKVLAPFDISSLSRRDIKNLNFKFIQRLRGLRTLSQYEEYKQKEGQLINGVFLRKLGRDMIVHIGDVEGKLTYREQVPMERYRQGDNIRVYIKEVSMENNRLNILLSRTDPRFVIRLFENEVAELNDGVVKVKSIVREVGQKTKMAVYSNKSDVEPVGACVGLYGNRIKAVMKELYNERIDIIGYTSDIKQYIARALDAGKIKEILLINREQKEALVIIDDESYPMVIGKNGLNVKLASRLVGWEISIRKESQMQKHPDIVEVFSKIDDFFEKDTEEEDLSRLTDIDEEILVKIMNAGISTISELYEKSIDEIAKIDGVGEENAKKIREVLDDIVELVEEDDSSKKSGTTQAQGDQQEIQQIEYLVCPSCSYEFEYNGEDACPKCNSEFEFEEEK